MTALTRVTYLYRDASNYKQEESVVLFGAITDEQREQVLSCLDDGDGHFIPEQIGWPHPGSHLVGFPGEDDHCWCELTEDGIELVSDTGVGEQVHATVEMWADQMFAAKTSGWDDGRWGK